MTTPATTEQLLYGFDPLCGWCFAFGPSYRALRAAHPDLPFTLRYGGLVTGPRVGPIAESRDYLLNGLAQVRERAGVVAGAPFYEGLLAEGRYISDSEPPCRAIWAAERLAPAQAADFAAAMPDAFYQEGLALDDPANLRLLAERHGIDGGALVELWASQEARAGTQAAFRQAQAAGFSSYPTLAYQRGGQLQLIARGWLPPDVAVARVGAARSAP